MRRIILESHFSWALFVGLSGGAILDVVLRRIGILFNGLFMLAVVHDVWNSGEPLGLKEIDLGSSCEFLRCVEMVKNFSE